MCKWMLRVNGVAGLCCGALSGGDVDGSCGGGGDCCVVAVGKVVVVPVRRCCRACLLQVVKAQELVVLMQWMVIRKVGSQWLEGSRFGPVLKGPWLLW